MREITYHDRTDIAAGQHVVTGEWGNYNPQGHRTFHVADGDNDVRLFLFDDEVDSDEQLYTTEEVLAALEQAISEVCDEQTQNAVSDRYRELIGDGPVGVQEG